MCYLGSCAAAAAGSGNCLKIKEMAKPILRLTVVSLVTGLIFFFSFFFCSSVFLLFMCFSGGGQTTKGSRFIAPSTVLECFFMLY